MTGTEPGPLPGHEVHTLDAYWRAANYLSAGQIHLMANPLLAEPLADLPGGSGDMRDVRLAADSGNPSARLALEVYAHRLRAQIAAMAAALGGVDTLVFTDGIGEHQADVRAQAAAELGFLGVAVDESRNVTAKPDCDISVPSAAVRTLVIAAREDIEIARQTRAALAAG